MVQNVCFITFSANFRYDSLKLIKSGGECDLGRFELIGVLKGFADELIKAVEGFEMRLEGNDDIRAGVRLIGMQSRFLPKQKKAMCSSGTKVFRSALSRT